MLQTHFYSALFDETPDMKIWKDFKNARDYIKKFKQNVWDDCWSAYNNIRTKRGYDGVADDFIPETFTIVESIRLIS